MNWLHWLFCIIFGYLGGLIVNTASLLELKRKPKKTGTVPLQDKHFWRIFFLTPLIGSIIVLSCLESDVKLKGLTSLYVGISWPSITNIASSFGKTFFKGSIHY